MKDNINRRDYLGLVGASLAAFALPGCSDPAKQRETARAISEKIAKEKPNFLWLSCEDISPDLGCYGSPNVNTPVLDSLAGQGVRFTNAFTVYPVCSPVRCGIITAMYPNSIGGGHMRTSRRDYQCTPPPYVHCFTEYLRAAGYYCTNRDKTDYQFDSPVTAWDLEYGWDGKYLPPEEKKDWRGRAPGQPFFTVLNYGDTHESMIRNDENRVPVKDINRITIPPYHPDTAVVRRDWAIYYENIEKLDAWVGEQLARLKADGLEDNTIVMFWGDHGAGMPRSKRWPYDSGTRIPLIVRWPGVIEPGSVSDRLVNCIDFGPTLLSLAGVEIPQYIQGKPFMGDQDKGETNYVFTARDRMDEKDDMVRTARDKRYHLIWNFMPEKPYAQIIDYMELMPTMQEWRRLHKEGKLNEVQELFFRETKPEFEFYDTEKDPWEVNNLADKAEYKDKIAEMKTAIGNWMAEIDDKGLVIVPEAGLKESMWPGGVQPVTADPIIVLRDGMVSIGCATEGASIAYTTETGEHPHWLLYTGPFTAAKGDVVQARSVRIGYKEGNPATLND